MLAFVLVAIVAGMMAGFAAMMLGSSIWTALSLYMISGIGVLLLVLVRAMICNALQNRDMRHEAHHG